MSLTKNPRSSVVDKVLKDMAKEEMDRIAFWVPRELKDRLFESARKNRTKPTYILIDLIKQYLNNQDRRG